MTPTQIHPVSYGYSYSYSPFNGIFFVRTLCFQNLEGLSLGELSQVIRTHSCVSCLSVSVSLLNTGPALHCNQLYFMKIHIESLSMPLNFPSYLNHDRLKTQLLLTHLPSLATGISESQCVDCGSCPCPLLRLSLCVVSSLFL